MDFGKDSLVQSSTREYSLKSAKKLLKNSHPPVFSPRNAPSHCGAAAARKSPSLPNRKGLWAGASVSIVRWKRQLCFHFLFPTGSKTSCGNTVRRITKFHAACSFTVRAALFVVTVCWAGLAGAAPEFLASWSPGPFGTPKRSFLAGTKAYFAMGTDGLWILDIADPAKPTR